jgi:hypothetical protein
MKVITQQFKLKRLVLITGFVFGMTACNTDDLAPPPPPPRINSVPVIISDAVTVSNEGQPYAYALTATDADADSLTYSSSDSSWLTIDTATGLLSGTPTLADVGDIVVTITVTDGTDSATQEFTIAVQALPLDNVAPEFTSDPVVMGDIETAYSYAVTAADANFDDLTFTAPTLPDWATFDMTTNTLSGQPEIPGSYPVELTVTDGTLDISQSFNILITGPAVVTTELVVFETLELPEWALWGDAAAETDVVTDDLEHDQVAQFTITGATVAGFDSRDAGTPFDASEFASNGQFSFEMKVVTAPTAGEATPWFLKLEAADGSSTTLPGFVDIQLTSSNEGLAPVTGEWQTYTFDLADLTPRGLNPSEITIFMIFPAYGPGEGAVYLVDNVKIVSVVGGVEPSPTPANIIDFEDAADTYVFTDFGGGAASILANPDVSGINTSAQVARMQKFAAEVYGGSTFTLPSAIDLTDGDIFTLKVWSTRSVPVLLKLEGISTQDNSVERTVNHNGTGWEELTFDFTGDSGTGVPAITLIFENGTNGDADVNPDDWTFYFDDMGLPEGDAVEPEPVAEIARGSSIDFEAAADTYTFNNFNGGVASVIDNPDTSGSNPSAQVARMQKFAEETYGGTTFTLPGVFNVQAGDVFTMKVWSDRVVPVLFKLEELSTQDNSVERTVVHQGMGWEVLTFDFTGNTGDGLAKITFIFDNGVMGDAADNEADWTFYFDDIVFPEGDAVEPEPAELIAPGSSIDFEAAADTYTFGNFNGGVASVIDNPDTSGSNPSAQVARMQKFAEETYGGTTFTLPGVFNVQAGDVFTMKVWSDRVVPVLFKLEELSTQDNSVERTVVHQGMGWEVLTFDFTGNTGDGLASLTFIFDNGVMGDAADNEADWTFYFDDIVFPE